jgi:hypothetical protein
MRSLKLQFRFRRTGAAGTGRQAVRISSREERNHLSFGFSASNFEPIWNVKLRIVAIPGAIT